jgi:hypothetical protein
MSDREFILTEEWRIPMSNVPKPDKPLAIEEAKRRHPGAIRDASGKFLPGVTTVGPACAVGPPEPPKDEPKAVHDQEYCAAHGGACKPGIAGGHYAYGGAGLIPIEEASEPHGATTMPKAELEALLGEKYHKGAKMDPTYTCPHCHAARGPKDFEGLKTEKDWQTQCWSCGSKEAPLLAGQPMGIGAMVDSREDRIERLKAIVRGFQKPDPDGDDPMPEPQP